MAGLLARVLMTNSAGLYPPMRNGSGKRKRVPRSPTRKRARAAKRARTANRGRLKKGSAAAKAYMAKIRRKRRR